MTHYLPAPNRVRGYSVVALLGMRAVSVLLAPVSSISIAGIMQIDTPESIARSADLICKATVLSDGKVSDDSFPAILSYEVHEAELRVVSVVKGAAPNVIRFRYYATSIPDLSSEDLEQLAKAMPQLSRVEIIKGVKALSEIRMLSGEELQQAVRKISAMDREHLEKVQESFKAISQGGPDIPTIAIGRTYLVSATQTAGDTYRQLGKSPLAPRSMALALMPTLNAQPHQGTTFGEVVWTELLALLRSPNEDEAIAAIGQLDRVSGGPASMSRGSGNPDRVKALAAIQSVIESKSVRIATAAITVFGMDSPYYEDPYEHDLVVGHWFNGLGNGCVSGLAARNRPSGPVADIGAKELLDVADNGKTPELRSLAIRALGRDTHAYQAAMVAQWLRDPSIEVRRAAVLVSADLPDRQPIMAASRDVLPQIRRSAAYAVGFAQDPGLVRLLGELLQDPVPDVRNAAAVSVLSFALDQSAPVLRANLSSDFRPLFVNALARQDAQPYVDILVEVIEEQGPQPNYWKRPPNWNFGGTVPPSESWQILFDFLESRPATELASGRFDHVLDALERSHWGDSKAPSLYALYRSRGLDSRATQLRERTRKGRPYDITFFDRADQNPAQYLPADQQHTCAR